MPGVGAVGAKLRYRDGTVQHAGIVHGYHDGLAGHAFKNMPADDWGYLGYMRVARECSGVTAACMLTPRALFLELGGLDETEFAVAYGDADYCYRLSDRGYRSIVCPDAELIHDEGKSRGFDDNPDEVAVFRRRYRPASGAVLQSQPVVRRRALRDRTLPAPAIGRRRPRRRRHSQSQSRRRSLRSVRDDRRLAASGTYRPDRAVASRGAFARRL